jgi:hypothetical protein
VEPGGKHKKLGSDGDNRRNVAGFNIIFIYIIYLNIYFVMLCASNVVMTLGKMVRRDCPKYTTGYDRSSKYQSVPDRPGRVSSRLTPLEPRLWVWILQPSAVRVRTVCAQRSASGVLNRCADES